MLANSPRLYLALLLFMKFLMLLASLLVQVSLLLLMSIMFFVVSHEAVDPAVVDVFAAVVIRGVLDVTCVPAVVVLLSLLLLACLLLQVTHLLMASSLLLASRYLWCCYPCSCYSIPAIDRVSAIVDILFLLASLLSLNI
jgi:hypothetical protein